MKTIKKLINLIKNFFKKSKPKNYSIEEYLVAHFFTVPNEKNNNQIVKLTLSDMCIQFKLYGYNKPIQAYKLAKALHISGFTQCMHKGARMYKVIPKLFDSTNYVGKQKLNSRQKRKLQS